MKNRLVAAFVLAGGVLAVGSPVLAHHGNAAYADTITEFKQATVTKVAWANPHALIDFDAKECQGQDRPYGRRNGGSPGAEADRLEQDSVAPGDVVTVRMYVAKNGNPAGRLNKIILADGSELHDTQLGGDAGGKSRYDPDAKWQR